MESYNNNEKQSTSFGGKLFILIEIALVLLPLYAGLYLSDYFGLDHIALGGSTVILGGYLQYVGLVVSMIVLAVFSWRRKAKWSDFGIKRPKNWLITILIGILISGAVFVLVRFAINPLMGALFPDAVRDMSRFEYLYQNVPNLIIQLVVIWVTAAFLEEFIFRGYLLERLLGLGKKPSVLSVILVLLFSSVIFGLAHLYQGLAGMIRTGAIGLIFAVAYFVDKRSLLPLIVAHGLIDTLDMISHFAGN